MGLLPSREKRDEPEEPAADYRTLTEPERVAHHRTMHLLGLGFSMQQILRMRVGRQRFDWHRADDLLKTGQTHEQVTFRLED